MAASRRRKKNKVGPASIGERALGKVRAEIGRARAGRWGAKDSFTGINAFRETIELRDIGPSVATLAKHPAYKTAIWPSPLPRSWNSFSQRTFRAYLDFERELEWTSHALLSQLDVLQDFLPLKAQYDGAILVGDHPAATAILDDIEGRFGLSVWLAEARISRLQATQGFKAQKEFVRQVTSQSSSGLVRFLVAWIALKYEENTSYAQLKRLISRFGAEEIGFHYLVRLLLGDFTRTSPQMAGHALSHADTLPVIDRYIAFCKIIHAVQASNSGDVGLHASIRRSLRPIANQINDAKLRRAYFASGGEISIGLVRASFGAALDAYTSGDYGLSELLSNSEIESNVSGIPAVDLLQRSRSALGKVEGDHTIGEQINLKQEIANCIGEILRIGPKAVEKRQRLQKIGIVYSNCDWSAGVCLIAPPDEDRRDTEFGRMRACYLALQSPENHPLLAGKLSPLIPADRYLGVISNEQCITVRLMRVAFGSADPIEILDQLAIPAGRRCRYKAIALIERGAAAEALPILRDLYDNATTSRDRFEAGEMLVAGLLHESRLGEASDVAAALLLKSSFFAAVLPLSKLVSDTVAALEEGEANDARGKLSVAIVADMYARYIAPDQEVARSDAYKDFLRAHGVRRPSELAERLTDFPPDEISYFLRYVCVPEVMDQSLALPSTIDVENERVAVLLMLTDLTSEQDRETQLAFLEELREIRTRQVVRDTNKRLEQSKIFVNVEGIKKRVDASIKDSWDRYQLLLLQPDETDLIVEVRRVLEKSSGGTVIALPLSMPETERGQLFRRMVAEIRDLFVDSKEFGLDANLSANIRHGYVLREIRSPLLSKNLITNRPELEEPYEENAFWASRLNTLAPSELQRLQQELAAFSAEIDRKIDHLNSKVLRVHSATNPDGLFIYTVNAAQIGYLQQKAETVDNHDAFTQLVIKHFWAVTDVNLNQVRKYLIEVALQGFSETLDSLDKALDNVAHTSKLTSLRSAIALARPELHAAIGRVASWFTLSTEVDFPDYAAGTAYEAGIETIKSYAANVQINSTLECDDGIVLRGRTLPFIGRIIFIILDNIVEHSQIASGEIAVRCSIRIDETFLVFTIVSSLGDDADVEAVRRRADEVNAEYGTEKATQFISVERRSGYPKIWKILTHDLQVEHLLEVSVDEDSREFKVEIMMAAAHIVKVSV